MLGRYLIEPVRKLIREAVSRLDSIHRRLIIEKLKKLSASEQETNREISGDELRT